MKHAPRILVVEDEAAIAQLIAVNLRHAGYESVLVLDGRAAQHEIDKQLPDAILLDWMLPGESGLTLARRWRAHPRTREIPILMLTARAEEADRVSGLDAGADDYIVKPFSTKELLARVRAVLRRRAPHASGEAVTVGVLTLDPSTHRVTWRGAPVKLGPTEFRLLHHLLRAPERVHSRAQLLDKVWGDHVFIEERTVDVHIKRLRENLCEAAGEAGAAAIETVRGAGYRLSVQALDAHDDK
ncbi:MAG: phosphate regulon transcriptional regulator PhoB [Burkholderiaceae bacterium]|jgi:two-component system phosphate regulon response regulator PhoB|nr:phosphate regulon transcriptional regulator PhoB [Burkholderiaceae bacterium]